MKKIVALFTAMMFAMTLGVAFAQDQAAPAAEKKAEAPVKKEKKAKKVKKVRKAKKEKKAKKKEEKAEAPAAK